MNQSFKKNLKGLLKKYEIKSSKKLGQHFLIDKKAIQKIIKAGNIKQSETVLEIGPGPGILTTELTKLAKKVIAVEKDEKMCKMLKKEFEGIHNLKIIEEDILKLNLNILEKNYKVIANIPYYITSCLIRKLLEEKNRPKEIILTIQKEVAQRICSKPPKMNLLAVSVQFYATAEIISYISKKSFWPIPKVDSAIIKIIPFKSNSQKEKDNFFKIVRAGFSQPRKQLLNNLYKGLKLNSKKDVEQLLLKEGICPKRRAETLIIEEWIKLAKLWKT